MGNLPRRKKKIEQEGYDNFSFSEYMNDVTAEGRLYKRNEYRLSNDLDNFVTEDEEGQFHVQSEYNYFDENATDTGLCNVASNSEIEL